MNIMQVNSVLLHRTGGFVCFTAPYRRGLFVLPHRTGGFVCFTAPYRRGLFVLLHRSDGVNSVLTASSLAVPDDGDERVRRR